MDKTHMDKTHNPMNSTAAIMVTWTRPMLTRFKQALLAAKQAEQDVFIFDGNNYTCGYARYLVEFLETQLCMA